MKAAVVGCPYHIRFGGSTDFLFAADCADGFIRAAASDIEGAHAFNIHGDTVRLDEVVSEIKKVAREVCGAEARVTFDDNPLPFPSKLDDTAIRSALGDLPTTSLRKGVRQRLNDSPHCNVADRLIRPIWINRNISREGSSYLGIFRNPPILLKDGDVVEVYIENLGVLRNTVHADKSQ